MLYSRYQANYSSIKLNTSGAARKLAGTWQDIINVPSIETSQGFSLGTLLLTWINFNTNMDK